MPAAADTGAQGTICGCRPPGPNDSNPNRGRAVINEELSEGDEVVVEFIPSGPQGAARPAPARGNTTVEGGNVQNETSIAVDASGGEAAADAAGGDFNVVEVITGGAGNVNAGAGSGGTANADASGGAVVIGNVNSGGNAGSQIEVNQYSTGRILCFLPDGKAIVEVPSRLSMPAGNVRVEGGNVSNDTNIAVDASGGAAAADASGGDDNVVVVDSGRGNVNANAGTGGTANADASGGAVEIGNVNSGGNTGNDISVADDLGNQIRQRVNDRLSGRDNQGAARQGNCAPPPCAPGGALNANISGGNVSNETDIAVDASGGEAAADASGGDDNVVQVQGGSGNVNANAGTGGTANADASGGAVAIGNVNSGGNTGNNISLNNVGGPLLCLTGNDTLLLQLDLAPTGAIRPAPAAGRRPATGGNRPATGGTTVSGGTVTNETDITVDASGGTAASDASGGSGNIVVVEERGNGNGNASAGTGGTANADASGGAVVIGDVNSGGNTGNDIDVNDDDEDEED